jgi:chorismate mutase
VESLRDLRREIDKVDAELIKLLDRRVELARRIGMIKREMGIEVRDFEREQEVIERAGRYHEIFRIIIEVCRGVQI